MSGQCRWLRRFNLGLGNELEIMGRDIEDPRRCAIIKRNAHAAFAGEQPQVANERFAVEAGQLAQIEADAAAGPGAQQHAIGRPDVARPHFPGLFSDSVELSRPPNSSLDERREFGAD